MSQANQRIQTMLKRQGTSMQMMRPAVNLCLLTQITNHHLEVGFLHNMHK